MLPALGVEVVVVEEAAEMLESHLIVALSSSTRRLILIGDHHQLRPVWRVVCIVDIAHHILSCSCMALHTQFDILHVARAQQQNATTICVRNL